MKRSTRRALRFLIFSSILIGLTGILYRLSDDFPGRRVKAATFTVMNTNDSGAGSLRQAILDANSAGGVNTINFDTAGVFATPQTISLTTVGNTSIGNSALGVDAGSQITIVGPSAAVTIARDGGAPEMRLFFVAEAGSLTLQNLTLTKGLIRGGHGGGGPNGEGGGGGGAGLGGAIYNDFGTLAIENCTLSGNSAVGGNGGNGSGFTNAVGGGGGGLNGDGQDGLSGGAGGLNGGGNGGSSTNGGNGGFGGGGGGGGYDGECGLNGGNGGFGGGGGGGSGGRCSGPNNGLGGFGGGNGGIGESSNGGAGGGGGAGFGGAIFNNVGNVSISNSTISGNTATGGNGGDALGIGNAGDAGSGDGGGIVNFNGFFLRTTAQTAKATAQPTSGASFTVSNSTVANNTAQGGNGGNSNPISTGTNGGNGGDAEGGGIVDLGNSVRPGAPATSKPSVSLPAAGFSLMNSTVASNKALGGSGGTGGPISDRPVQSGSKKGGPLSDDLADTSLVANGVNGTGNGGGVYTGGCGCSPVFSSDIIANNTAAVGPDSFNDFPVNSQGYNLIGKSDGSAGFTQPTDQKGTVATPLDPKLDPAGLQNNGGPTKTIKLITGSPAIDKGISNGLTTDQRGPGFARKFDFPSIGNAAGGDGTDVGAYEVQGSPCLIDTTPPTITCPGSITKFTDPGQFTATVNPGNPIAADNCQLISVVGTRSDGKPVSAPYPIGTTIITWTATDAAGNKASCSQTIMVMQPSDFNKSIKIYP